MPVAAAAAADATTPPLALAAYSRKTQQQFEVAYLDAVERWKALPDAERERQPNPTKAGRKYLALGYDMAMRMYFSRQRRTRPPTDPYA